MSTPLVTPTPLEVARWGARWGAPWGAPVTLALLVLAAVGTGAYLVAPRRTAPALAFAHGSTVRAEADRPRPTSAVTVVRSEPLAGSPGKWVTTVLVHYPPLAMTPRHVHGGDVTAYVVRGRLRSEHGGLPVADYPAGSTFFEPFGTTHVFIENPSATEDADLVAVTVHDPGATLTTLLP